MKTHLLRTALVFVILLMCFFGNRDALFAQRTLELTPESIVDIIMSTSYEKKHLDNRMEEDRWNFKKYRANQRSRIGFAATAPSYSKEMYIIRYSDYQAGTDKYIENNETNTQFYGRLSFDQPVNMFNGSLSLDVDYRKYDSDRDYTDINGNPVNYYNKSYWTSTYLRYNQPLFIPNYRKMDIESTDLSFERSELQYFAGQAFLIYRARSYYASLLREEYMLSLYSGLRNRLNTALASVQDLPEDDPARISDEIQIHIEIENANNSIRSSQTSKKNLTIELIKELRLENIDSLYVSPEITVSPVSIDIDRAIEYGLNLNPQMRMSEIGLRHAEMSIDYAKSTDPFRMDLSMQYEITGNSDEFDILFDHLGRGNSIILSTSYPIWNWGKRKAALEGAKVNLKDSRLSHEETKTDIETNIRSQYNNYTSNIEKATVLQNILEDTRASAETSLNRFAERNLSVQELLQNLDRHMSVERNLLYAYTGSITTLAWIEYQTFYDFSDNVSLIDRYGFKRAESK
ncbi:TolC family protein [candidate division KSB1 bacterium]